MEVFNEWQITDMIRDMLTVTRNVSLVIIGAFLALRILVEIYKVMVVENFRFSVGQFVPILILVIAILSYSEIIPLIGDGFYALGNAIRGEGENTFNSANLWEAIKDKAALEDKEEISFWDVVKAFGSVISNPFDMLQNIIGLQNAMVWQVIGLLFRLGMIFFKNIIYGLLLIMGPIPLMLGLIPGLQGVAAHWMKNFIVVCCWGVILAMLDVIMDGLQLQILKDVMLGGDEELTLSFLTMFTAILYLFVPYITSLVIGQTIVAVAGSKFVTGPISTALTAFSLGAGISALSSIKEHSGPPVINNYYNTSGSTTRTSYDSGQTHQPRTPSNTNDNQNNNE